MSAKPRPKKCKACGERFTPFNSLQSACSTPCALIIGRKKIERREKEKTKLMREALKTRGDFVKEAQKAFNGFIRERDYDEPCISCDKPAQSSESLTGGYWDAGHYRSTGSAPNCRFVEDNCHKQCKQCNNNLSGNIVEYRKRLIERIGIDRVEAVEADQEPRRYTIEELKELAKHYRKEMRELKKQRLSNES